MPHYYSLSGNELTPESNDRRAIVQVDKTYSLEDLIDHMTSRGSTITKAEGLSVLEEFFHAVENVCRNGNSVNTSLFIIKPGIAGGLPKFDEADPLQGVFLLTRITELL